MQERLGQHLRELDVDPVSPDPHTGLTRFRTGSGLVEGQVLARVLNGAQLHRAARVTVGT